MRLFYSTIILTLISTIALAQWEKVYDESLGPFGQVINHNNYIFATGDDDTMLRLSDGGNQIDDISANLPIGFHDTFSFKGKLYGAYIRSISVSENNGESWQQIADLDIQNDNGAIRQFSSDQGNVLYGITNRESIYRSEDGTSWEEIIVSDADDAIMYSVAASGDNWVVTFQNRDMKVSTDGGQSWSDNIPETPIVQVYNHNGTIFGFTGNGVFRYDPSIQSWTASNNGIFNNGLFLSAKVMHTLGNTLYVELVDIVGGNVNYVYKSDDNGASWQAVSLEGMPLNNTAFYHSYLDSDDTYLYYYYTGFLDPQNNGIYKFAHGEITSVEENSILPTEFSLEQNYPNPFNPVTTIKYAIPTSEFGHQKSELVSLHIYDILGNKIADTC
jgi:photosystem II stability/assembly factor-like uncharacterized protein